MLFECRNFRICAAKDAQAHADGFERRVGRSHVALGGGELRLMRCERIQSRETPRILIGGLGMGFTLRAALAALGADARITVAELVPAVLAWARGPMAEVLGSSLTDPRVSAREADVGDVIRSGSSAFDAILLDVDNGPEGLTRKANDALYDLEGLRATCAALHPGGVLAVWSAKPDLKVSQRIREAGFEVDEVRVRANGSRGGARHVIWIATRADGGRRLTPRPRAAGAIGRAGSPAPAPRRSSPASSRRR